MNPEAVTWIYRYLQCFGLTRMTLNVESYLDYHSSFMAL